MSGCIESRVSVRLFIARTVSLGFLVFHAMRYLGDMVLLLPAIILFFVSVFTAFFLERSRLRFLPAAALFGAILAAGRGLVFLVFHVYQVGTTEPGADFLFFRFDSTFLPMLPAVLIVWLFTFLSRRYREFIPWECGLNTAFFAALFWSQAGFDVKIYPHPGYLALASLLYVLLQVFILVETTTLRTRLSGHPGRKYKPLVWVLVPLLILFLLFMYNWYTREAVSHGGGLIKPTFFRFDFSRYIRLESEISLEDDLVLLVRKEGGEDSVLLRRFILSGYRSGEGFFFEAEPGSRGFRTVVPDSPVSLHDPGYRGREDVLQEYYIVNFDPSSLISINYPVNIAPLTNWDKSSFLRIYRVKSRVSGFIPFELSECPGPVSLMDTALYEYYTEYGGDEAVRERALEVTSAADTYYERVVAIESYLLENYFYSLKPGVAGDGNQLHHFLFESKKGYCSYFAFAMALMARSVGIPARVAVGFFTDPGSEIFNYFPVRADMAHAWVEVFFPGYGWIEFDPTSRVIAPGEEYQFESMDMQEVSSLIEEILKNRYQLKEEEGLPEDDKKGPVDWFQRTVARLKRLVSAWYLLLPGMYLCICVLFRLVYAFMAMKEKKAGPKVKRLYSKERFILRNLGLGKRTGETVSEYAERIDTRYGTKMKPFTAMYLKALFSRSFGPEDFRDSLECYATLKASIRGSLSLPRRVAGFLNPFGFGRRRG